MNFLNTITLLTNPINNTIYTTQDNEINKAGIAIIKMVGGIGGTAFTLAILIIAIVIIFGSISSKNIGKVWGALFSCLGGALLFYSAYFLAPAIAKIVA
ncbi:hypothetical protein MHH81_20720 [Psychrobacillus sp. FSL H8-0484]|uniref:hypothetical protein n=1 Tax=Psychrobacillus sp. FSL H8-0484 TaxID=2921390 RepID=UPI0030FCD732